MVKHKLKGFVSFIIVISILLCNITGCSKDTTAIEQRVATYTVAMVACGELHKTQRMLTISIVCAKRPLVCRHRHDIIFARQTSKLASQPLYIVIILWQQIKKACATEHYSLKICHRPLLAQQYMHIDDRGIAFCCVTIVGIAEKT